jgi:dTDP-4-amino-4,6-dideoxygalactose transaminase
MAVPERAGGSRRSDQIPVFDPRPDIEVQRDELMAAIGSVLDSGRFILGPQVEAFEGEVAAYLGAAHAIGVNSGTDALVIALRSLGVGPGDEVLTPSFTFFATPEAVTMVGATPVFVDIDPATLTIDPMAIEGAITDRTKAIIPVHLFGLAADMDAVTDVGRRRGVAVLEDLAQAMGGSVAGQKLGTLGDVAALSFFPTKNLGGFGDGGMIVTDDDATAAQARKLRTHGSVKKYANELFGYNSRLDELQAAILRVRLERLDETNAARRAVAARYDELLDPVPGVARSPEARSPEHVYHQYTTRILEGRRDEVRERLAEEGIGTAVYYPTPCHLLPPYAGLGIHLRQTEAAADEVVSLPMWPSIVDDDVVAVAQAIRRALT